MDDAGEGRVKGWGLGARCTLISLVDDAGEGRVKGWGLGVRCTLISLVDDAGEGRVKGWGLGARCLLILLLGVGSGGEGFRLGRGEQVLGGQGWGWVKGSRVPCLVRCCM